MSNLYTNIAMFDADFYVNSYVDLQDAGITPATAGEHYFQWGASEGRTANKWFDIAFYRSENPDLVGLTDGELLWHFAVAGAAEGRSPNAAYSNGGQLISQDLYLAYALANADIAAAFGIAEDATELTDEQFAQVANQYFNWGVNEPREGGIADLDPFDPTEPEGEVDLEVAIDNYAEAKAELNDADTKLDEAEDAYNEAVSATEEALGAPTAGAVSATGLFAAGDAEDLLPENLAELTEAQQENAINSAKGVLQADVDEAQLKVDQNLKGADLKNAKALSNAKVELKKALDDVEAKSEAIFGDDGIAETFIEANEDKIEALLEDGSAAIVAVGSFEEGNYSLQLEITKDNDKVVVPLIGTSNGQIIVLGNDSDFKGTDKLLVAVKALQKAETATVAPKEAVAAAVIATLKDNIDDFKVADLKDAGGDAFAESTKFTLVEGTESTKYTLAGIVDGKPVAVKNYEDIVEYTLATADDASKIVYVNEAGADGDKVKLEEIANGKNDDYEGADDGFYADLVEAQEDLKAFNAAVEKWEDAKAAEADAKEALENAEEVQEAAAEALADAKAAIEALVSTEEVEMNFVEAVNGAAEGTSANDLFVYVKGEELDITKFGQKGEDKLYVGPEYTLVEVESRADIKGDAGVLEIFVFQEGGNTVLAVEQDPYSGSVAGTEDLTDITLVGVDANIVQDDQGFIVLA